MPMIAAGKSNSPLQADKESRFALACRLYRDGACAESYRLFSDLEQDMPDTAALYANMALCHMRAQEWQAALSVLEKALSLIKKQPKSPGGPAPNATYTQLSRIQAGNDSYLRPMPLELPAIRPDYAKQTVLRLMVDVCAQLELWERVLLLGEPLLPGGFGNITRAVEAARTGGGPHRGA